MATVQLDVQPFKQPLCFLLPVFRVLDVLYPLVFLDTQRLLHLLLIHFLPLNCLAKQLFPLSFLLSDKFHLSLTLMPFVLFLFYKLTKVLHPHFHLGQQVSVEDVFCKQLIVFNPQFLIGYCLRVNFPLQLLNLLLLCQKRVVQFLEFSSCNKFAHLLRDHRRKQI